MKRKRLAMIAAVFGLVSACGNPGKKEISLEAMERCARAAKMYSDATEALLRINQYERRPDLIYLAAIAIDEAEASTRIAYDFRSSACSHRDDIDIKKDWGKP
jgi:hypothetical protein